LTAIFLVLSLLSALPAHAATTNYGPKSATIDDATGTAAPRYVTYTFPVSGASTIDSTLSWPTGSGADLNIVIKNPAGNQVAATSTVTPNPEQLSYTTPASATGNWKIVAFARKGSAKYTLNWSVTSGPAPNQAPKPKTDAVATPAGTAVTIDVLGNDTDADGPGPMTVGTVTNGASGTVTDNGSNVTYTPTDSLFNGTDTFSYTACDASSACSGQTNVTVTVGNPPPVANNDSATATTNVAKTIDVLANDTGSGSLSVGTVSDPAHGTVTNNGTNVTYTSAANYSGPDQFSYTACVAPSVCSTGATVSVTVQAPGGTGNYLKVFTPQNIGSKNSFTQDEANAVAKNFDVIVATPAAFKGKVPGMHAVNPNLAVLAYVNSAFVGSTQGPTATHGYPAAWYMRDANGNPVQSKYNNYMMDITNQSWVDDRKSSCKNAAQASGYDGCSLDMLGTAPLDPGYTKTAPIDPATKAVWTAAAYYNASSSLAKQVQDFSAPLLVDGNGLRAGNQYFSTDAPSKKLFQGTREAMAEAFIRPGPTACSSYRNESQWKQDVDMLVDAGRSGHGVMTLTKIWCSGTQEVKDAVHEYTLASFLMGTDGHSFFFVSYADGTDATAMHPWWKTNIGSPAGPFADYGKAGGAYIRTFTNGLVLVNPTTAAANVTLPAGSYKDINTGTVYSGTVSVPVHAGWVLVNN
jgi:hypothetical protein